MDEIGGGVCQPSSTLYLACLRANLEITERYAHRYVPAYIPWGMDATVSWGGPDYKFTNNTNYPIKIVTSYSGGYLTVKILGTNADGITAKITNETLSTTPWETVYEDDPTLPAGTEKVKTTPYTGYKVRTYRNLYDANGKLISSTYEATSDYKVRNKVIARGPACRRTPRLPAPRSCRKLPPRRRPRQRPRRPPRRKRRLPPPRRKRRRLLLSRRHRRCRTHRWWSFRICPGIHLPGHKSPRIRIASKHPHPLNRRMGVLRIFCR